MAYDYSKLRERISTVFGTSSAFAVAMNLSEHSVSKKLNGKTPWKQNEILRACGLLYIPESEMHSYFFAVLVQ